MNPQTYAQMLQLQQQKGAPLTSQGQAPMQQQAPAEAPRYDLNNPLSEGSMAAVNAARESMKGKSGKKPSIFHNVLNGILGTVKNAGLAKLRGSNIGAERQLGHFYKTQEEEEAQKAQENEKILQFLQTNEIMKQKQANEIAMQNHKAAQLSEQRRHHDMQSRHQGAHSDYYRAMAEKARTGGYGEQEGLPEGAVPYSQMTSQEKSKMTTSLLDRINRPKEDLKVLKKLDRINEISHQNPHLATSLAMILTPQHYEGSAFDTLRIKLNDALGGKQGKKDRALLEEAEKIYGDLVIKKVHGLAGQRANMFLEKQMKKSNPHSGLTPDAAQAIRDSMKLEYDENLPEARIARKAYSGRYGIPEREHEYKEPKEAVQQKAFQDVSSLSNEEKDALSRKMGLIK